MHQGQDLNPENPVEEVNRIGERSPVPVEIDGWLIGYSYQGYQDGTHIGNPIGLLNFFRQNHRLLGYSLATDL
jgi:hypothetical protein